MRKSSAMLLAAAAALFLGGCLVTSVLPFYTEKDLVFEPALVGDWINKDKDASHEVWRLEKSGERAYRFTLIEERQATVMEAHAFKLQGRLFLDIASMDRDVRVIPPHCLLKVASITPTLKMSHLDNDWLRKLLAKDSTAIPHHMVRSGDKPDDLRVVLTANTPELQKFVLKHLDTAGAWKADVELKRESPPAGVQP
jgi:hypothetical protein